MDPDIAYANRDFIPDADEYLPYWEDAALNFRHIEHTVGRARLNVPYGPDPREALDLFMPAGRPEGVMVFVHGGYWRAFDRSYWSHFAAGATSRGWAVAMPSYPLAPQVRVGDITRCIRAALQRACELVPKGPVVLTGHSAGGHLVLRMICDDVDLPGVVSERLRSVLAISPVTDLRPLMDTKMNEDLRLDAAEAAAESPILRQKGRDVRVISWVGAEERSAFLDQAQWICDAWSGTKLIVAPGRHHFDVIDDLGQSDSPMMAELFGPRRAI